VYQIGDDDFTALVKHACGIHGCSGGGCRFSICVGSGGGISGCGGCVREGFVYTETTSAFTDATVARFGGDDV
jgi:hypothetical protein